MQPLPAWTRETAAACTLVRSEKGDPVDVFAGDDDRPCVRLVPAGAEIHALDAAGQAIGSIHREGFSGLRFVMRRGEDVVWTLSVRSVLLTRHRLELAHGETWGLETPWFTWMNVRGTTEGAPRLLGNYQSSKRRWLLWIEPGRATPELLAAVGLLHRQWCRW